MLARALSWAAAFAVLAVVQRAVVLTVAGVAPPGWAGVLHLAATLPELALLGLVLALALGTVRSRLAIALTWLAVTAVVAVHAAAVRYEAVFDRLPTAAVVASTYASGELGPSLVGNALPWLLALELVGVVAVLVVVDRLGAGGHWLWPWRPVAVLVAVVALVALVRPALDRLVEDQPWRHRSPFGWLAESSLGRHEMVAAEAGVGSQDILWLQRALGHRVPFAGGSGEAPLCAAGARGSDRGWPHRSVILVIMESVGSVELAATYQGRAVMPELAAFAARNLHFARVEAAGTKSGSAMAPLFCGLPPQTYEHLLHRVPLNTMEGFPRLLAERGYRTAYVHGADLAWEFQRSFLRMVGFAEIVERDPRRGFPRFGWGWSDEVTAGLLREWVATARREDPARPFLATWFTLSSHDPYDLPPEWPRRFAEEDARSRLYESLAYLDHHLGQLFSWYEAEEAPRGTLLVLVGDHTPHLVNREPTPRGPVFRFEVPLVVAGAGRPERATAAAITARRGAHYDLPATLLAALGLPALPCDQGVDLLAAPADWPADRVVYAVGGEDLEEVQLWLGDEHVVVDRLFRGAFAVAPAAAAEPSPRVRRFLEVMVPLNRYLTTRDAYALAAGGGPVRPPLARVERPLVVSHRGRSGGPDELGENTLAAVERALAAGFQCVEVDLQLTRDQVPVVAHDPIVVDREGRQRALAALDLGELETVLAAPPPTVTTLFERWPEACFVLEMKPQEGYDRQEAFGEAVAALTRARAARQRLIVDSFSAVQVAATVLSAECEVGWDLPFGAPVSDALLGAAVLAGVDWVFVEAGAVTAEAVAAAHARGLKVMAYTVNRRADLDRLGPELPDGVITDSASLVAGLGER